MGKILLGVLGIGKGSWGHMARLISDAEWDRIILVSNDWGKENFSPSKECEWIMVNNRAGFGIVKDEIKKNIPGGDIVVSLASGSGKEHMALLAALKEKGVNYQIVTLTGEGIKYY